jgi:hypothetical protein
VVTEEKTESVCAFCESAPAQVGILHQPACDACADSIASFYRGELPPKEEPRE